jgi:RNA polymerase sporulation-specific sigma factor
VLASVFLKQQPKNSTGKSTKFFFFSYTILTMPRGVSLKSFPPSLSADEEQYYLQKYIEGDLEAKHILIERNLRLVAHVIKKYQHLEENPEDLISIGTIGLIKAILTFNPDKNNRLGAYAARCIENEILMMLRGKKKISKEISLYEPIGTDRDGNEIQLYDIIEASEDDAHTQIALKDDIKLLYQKLESILSPRERLVLKLRYGLYGHEEYTQREIASLLCISRSYVSRIEKSAIEKLRDHF